MDTQKYLKVTRKFVDDNYPGQEAETVTIRFKAGGLVRMPVVGKTPACQIAGAREELAENELQILGFVPSHDAVHKSSEKIAVESGYKHNSYFRTLLRNLRKKGLVILEPAGYRKKK